jgi:hypothetical protein
MLIKKLLHIMKEAAQTTNNKQQKPTNANRGSCDYFVWITQNKLANT